VRHRGDLQLPLGTARRAERAAGDGELHGPSRAGRRGVLRGGAARARPQAADHSRHVQARAPAHVHRGRPARHHLQRRGLQLPRAAGGAGGQGAHLPDHDGHRGHPPPLPGRGRGHARQAQRHVRLRHLGPAVEEAVHRPRPAGHQAALLHRRRGGPRLRLGDQGAPRHRAGEAAQGQPGDARRLHERGLRAHGAHPLPGHREAAARLVHDHRPRRPAHAPVLGPEARAPWACCATPSACSCAATSPWASSSRAASIRAPWSP
jgi:hypothetical protein